MLAKCVFGNTGIKRVSRNILVTGEQGEFTFRDNPNAKSRLYCILNNYNLQLPVVRLPQLRMLWHDNDSCLDISKLHLFSEDLRLIILEL